MRDICKRDNEAGTKLTNQKYNYINPKLSPLAKPQDKLFLFG